MIHEVNKDGAAHRDGRLWAGDHILEVQNSSIHQWSCIECSSLISSQRTSIEPIIEKQSLLWTCALDWLQQATVQMKLNWILKWGKCNLFLSKVLWMALKCDYCYLLQVNGIDLRMATHEEALSVLRLSPQHVRLCIYRDPVTENHSTHPLQNNTPEDMWDLFSVELNLKPRQGLGLRIVGKRWVILKWYNYITGTAQRLIWIHICLRSLAGMTLESLCLR